MKRIRNIVIGGIQSKIFNLILITVILLSAANFAVYFYQSNMLAQVAADSAEQQQQSIESITSSVMNTVVTETLDRSCSDEAKMADNLFHDAKDRVGFLADSATNLFAHPENYSSHPYAGPDPDDDGVWTAKVIYADGVNAADPAIASRIGLAANLSDTMISMCRSFHAANAYMALPEGVHLSVSDDSGSWVTDDGQIRSYDPRERGWYQKAVEAGELIFTDGEWDANTGAYCIECAAPVYAPDGSLAAVIGTDVYLDDMQRVFEDSAEEGGYQLLVNSSGHAVLGPQADSFPMTDADREADLRDSELPLLALVVNEAMQGMETGVMEGELSDGSYYITSSHIETTGWILISAFSQETVGQPTSMLQEQNRAIQQNATQVYQEKAKMSRLTAGILLSVIAILMLVGAMILGKRIVKPLNTITKRISELSEGNLEFKMEDAFRTGDEVEELAQSFASISHKTVHYLDTVKRVTAEKERIGTELTLATQIQHSMLPHIVPAFPDRNDFDILGSMHPAKEVGGDFYDYFLVDSDHLCMVMADVSGKGVPAALFMMASKIILQSAAMLGTTSPAEILTRTNEAICSNNEAQMFVTVWLGILELSTGKLTAANAGHEYPVLMHADGRFALFKDKHGFVLGGLNGMRYKEYELRLKPGTKLFVYTDGIPEAANEKQEMFGTDRMIAALNQDPAASPQIILENVRKAVNDYVGDAEQFDDLTMLCLEYKGPDGSDEKKTV